MGYILHDNTKNSIEIYKDRRIARKSSPIEPAQDREGGRNRIPCKKQCEPKGSAKKRPDFGLIYKLFKLIKIVLKP